MKTIGELLETHSPFGKLLKKTQTSKRLALLFYSILDSDFATHCHFANYQDSVLTITVANAAWATRLRYAIPDMLKTLSTQPEFKELTKIRYVINQPVSIFKTHRQQTKLSTANQALWQDALKSLKERR